MARPTKLTPALQEEMVRAIRGGSYPEIAAVYAGIDRSTYYRWIERGDPEGTRPADRSYRIFRAAVEQAKAATEIRLVALISRAAENDWRAGAHLLARQNPARWSARAGGQREPPEPPVLALPNGTSLPLISMSDAELDAFERVLDKAHDLSKGSEKAGDPRPYPHSEGFWRERLRRVAETDPEFRRLQSDHLVASSRAEWGASQEETRVSQEQIENGYDAVAARYGLPPRRGREHRS